MTLPRAKPSGKPVPRSAGNEGCGEHIEHGGHHYYYHVGRFIPKTRPAIVTYEGMYCGRVHGEKEHLIVAWDGESFVVLEHCQAGDARKKFSKYVGMSTADAIAKTEERERRRQAELAAMPRCACGEVLINLDEKQLPSECYGCFKKRKP